MINIESKTAKRLNMVILVKYYITKINIVKKGLFLSRERLTYSE